MVYAPVGRSFTVHMEKIQGSRAKAWWFNPRNGEATAVGEYPTLGVREFMPPNPGEDLDWVLVLDAAGRNFDPPGAKSLIGAD